jgi:hypothetical protein
MKFIIDNRTTCSDEDAMKRVAHVMRYGLVSGHEGTEQYCYHTKFPMCHVSVDRRKSGTQRFLIHYNGEKEQ